MRGRLNTTPDLCIDLREANTEAAAEALGGDAFRYLKRELFPFIQGKALEAEQRGATDHYSAWVRTWWRARRGREEFFAQLQSFSRTLVCPNVCARPSLAFISTRFVPTNTMVIFAYDDDYSFGIVQSGLHWSWTKAKGGRVRADFRYTNEVWSTFPWPQEPSESEVVAVAEAARNLRKVRDQLMNDNGWSLRALYQAAEVPGPHPLKTAQAALDDAVRRAYGMPEGQEATEFLLELNKLVAEDEAAGREVQGPGVPRGMDPKDPRLMSEDCIEPPGRG
jgi:hypothetical protein